MKQVYPQARWAAGGFLPRLPESLEQLDLLLLTVAKSRKVRQDGIHFQGFAYLDTTLASPHREMLVPLLRDMAEIRVFHNHRFLCRAICAELAGETIALREIIQARTHRRKALRRTLQDRTRVVEALLEAHRSYHQADEAPMTNESALRLEKDMAHEATPKLKRYFNE